MWIYTGTFFLAAAMLALEITLTRLLSVMTWYHLAFFTIAAAMVGMTAGATRVYTDADRFNSGQPAQHLSRASLQFAWTVPLSLIILCLTPLQTSLTAMGFLGFLVVTLACAFPFYFGGIALTVVFTRVSLPIGRLYASDLLGASAGCLTVLWGLEMLDAPSLIISIGAMGAVASVAFDWKHRGSRGLRGRVLLFGVLLAAAGVNASSPRLIRPLVVKGQIRPAHQALLEIWNSFSLVDVYPMEEGPPFFWGGGSPGAPKAPVFYHAMRIDGAAGTYALRFRDRKDISHLTYAVTNVAYHLRDGQGAVCVIGVGGGRDMQSALLFRHRPVVGVDVNPTFIRLLTRELRDFVGLADREDVRFEVDDARSYLAGSKERFAVIQMALIDTWAATGAGAFSLSENTLYTVESWQLLLERLSPDGLLTVSRWYDADNLGETGRLVSLAMASLMSAGIEAPARHIALVTCGSVATLLVSRKPMTDQDMVRLKDISGQLDFRLEVSPDTVPRHAVLRALVSARSPQALADVSARQTLRFDPPTDASPYFFNMLRLSHLEAVWEQPEGVVQGNLIATLTLVGLLFALLVLALGTILVPLFAGTWRKNGVVASNAPENGNVASNAPENVNVASNEPEMEMRSAAPADPDVSIGVLAPTGTGRWPGALYFSAIGFGFMLLEVALIQRLSILLGHPIYALGILLAVIILSAGVGSILSERFSVRFGVLGLGYPMVCIGLILGVQQAMDATFSHLMVEALGTRIAAATSMIVPLGLVLGGFFPLGMRLIRSERSADAPWFWALNGIFGVIGSAVAVLLSIFVGISTNFYLAALSYALTPLAVFWILRTHGPSAPRESPPGEAHGPKSGSTTIY